MCVLADVSNDRRQLRWSCSRQQHVGAIGVRPYHRFVAKLLHHFLLVVQLMIRAEAVRPAAAMVQWPSGGDGIKTMSPDNAYVGVVATGVFISAGLEQCGMM